MDASEHVGTELQLLEQVFCQNGYNTQAVMQVIIRKVCQRRRWKC